jgi:tRNA A-37 threonylcarbamoyl transferase component Bud32
MRKRSIASFMPAAAEAPPPLPQQPDLESDETVFSPAPVRTIQQTLSQTIADAPRLEVGHMLNGRFVLAQRLGEGGMGTVFKALDLRKQEAQDRSPFVALKVLNEDFRHHPEALRSLQRETKKAQTLAHPNVITVHDFDRDGATLYMTMEYLPGQSLDRIVRARDFKGMPKQDAFKIVRDIGAALVYAHENGIIHLDLKPANIIVAENGRTKVIDFGIARAVARPHIDHGGDDTVFDAGVLNALTPTYASPEMLINQAPDPRDDVFAFACITYELLTGRHPFGRSPATEAQRSALKATKPPSLSNYQWRALQRGLSFDRDARTPNVATFVADVTAKSWWQRNALLLITVAALIAGAGAAAFYFEETAPEQIGVAAPENPSVSQVDWTAEMRNRLASAAEEAVRIAEATERVRLAAAQAAARSAMSAQAGRDGITGDAARKALIETAALRAVLAEVDHQTAVAAEAARIAQAQEEARNAAVDQAAKLAGSSDKSARAAAAAEVTRIMGASNEANRIAAAEEAARVVAEQAAAEQATVTILALRVATEGAMRGVAQASAAAAPKSEATLAREDRILIQKRLKALGFYAGGADGNFGMATRQAILAYQHANSWMATGILTPDQIASLLKE